MKFTTETSKLKEALAKLSHAVNTKSVLPVLANILVTLTKDKVVLTASDLMVTIHHGIECKADGEGQFLLPFTHLKNICGLESGDVTIKWQNETKGALAQFNQDIFSLGNPGTVADFPKLSDVSQKGMIDLNAEFVKAIVNAAQSTGKDENRPIMMNVCVELHLHTATVTSTDANTIYTHTIVGEFDMPEKIELLVPTVVAKVLDGFQTVKVGHNKNFIAFQSEDVKVIIKRAEGVFPGWRNVMPEHKANLKLDLLGLKDAVAKAFVMSDSTYSGIDFHITEKQLQLKTNVEDTGMSCDLKLTAESTSPVAHYRLSGRLLTRMIKQLEQNLDGSSQLSFSIQAVNKQCTVQLEDKPEVTVLLMPLNIA